jgi:aminoglycoside phosphotransferase (APT) family kinase protein
MARVAGVPDWSPEIVVDEALARRLLAEQFPELDAADLQLAGEGWDNTAWLVDRRWLFRFPRRAQALDGVRRELAVLPGLAPLLPLSVPRPLFVGQPGPEFPWPFFGGPVVPGRELADAGLDDDARAALARPLGRFLRALHSARLDVELPVDPLRRADMGYRVAMARQRLAELGGPPDGAEDVLEAALALPPSERLSIVHGDLHLRHVLVEDGRLSGVIDWGDVCHADPAIDLPLVWSTLPATARPEFLDEYGEVPPDGLLRARVLSIFLCAVLAVHARHEGLERLEREAVAGLERTLTD